MTVRELMNVFADEECFVAQNKIIRLHYFTEDEYEDECTVCHDYYSYKYSHKCYSFEIADYIANNIDESILETDTIYNFIHTENKYYDDTIYIDCQVITE